MTLSALSEPLRVLALAFLLQEAAPEFTKFEITRERVGHKVIVDATLANPLDQDLPALRVVAIFFDGARELRRSRISEVPRIAAGGAASFKIEAEQVENFSRYEVYVEWGGKARLYLGSDPLKPPVHKKAGPPKLAVTATKDEPPKAFPGEAVLTLTVRNSGESDAPEPTAVLSFLDGSSAVVRKERVRLEAAVKGATEDTFSVRVPGLPEYQSVQASLAWLAAEGPSLKDGEKADSVSVTRFRVVRLTDGSARVTGTVRNGQAGAVEKVSVGFKLGKTSAPYAVPGAMKPGEARDFEFYVADCPPFEAVGFDLSYSDGKAAAAAAPPARPSSRRTESRAIEIAGPKLPDAPAARQEAKQEEKAPALSVAIRGLLVVQGSQTKLGNKYTGDVYLMRAAFLDAEGKTVQPTGTFDIVLYDGEKPYKKIQRLLTKDQWKADAAKVNELTVSHDTVACDKKTGEIWIALLRTDGPGFTPRADVKLTIRDQGTWTWKGLEDKWEAAPRGPDEKKK